MGDGDKRVNAEMEEVEIETEMVNWIWRWNREYRDKGIQRWKRGRRRNSKI